MYKWIITTSILFLMIAGASIAVYSKARAPIKNFQEKAETRAKSEAGIVSIDQFYLYNGTETYYVIIGKQKDEKQIVVWIPEDKKKPILIKDMADGISEQEALNKLFSEENPSEILGVRLGMEKDLAVWELSYLDSKANLNYYYVHFETGKWWRKIENL